MKHRISSEWDVDRNARGGAERSVAQYDLDGKLLRVWKGSSEAARRLNIHSENISQCCTGKRISTGGFMWRTVNIAPDARIEPYKSDTNT